MLDKLRSDGASTVEDNIFYLWKRMPSERLRSIAVADQLSCTDIHRDCRQYPIWFLEVAWNAISACIMAWRTVM